MIGAPRRHRNRPAGFTLVELMTTVAMMAVLASVALTNYKQYKAKARRPAAKMALRAIADAQRGHQLQYGVYARTFDELGFAIEGGTRVSETEIQGRVFNYTLSQPLGINTWYCIATGNIDSDAFIETWSAQNID